jgi:hypothetical protein
MIADGRSRPQHPRILTIRAFFPPEAQLTNSDVEISAIAVGESGDRFRQLRGCDCGGLHIGELTFLNVGNVFCLICVNVLNSECQNGPSLKNLRKILASIRRSHVRRFRSLRRYSNLRMEPRSIRMTYGNALAVMRQL